MCPQHTKVIVVSAYTFCLCFSAAVMDDIHTVADLYIWAKRHGRSCENDTELNLRRIQLLAEQISQKSSAEKQRNVIYDGKQFKHRSHLLRKSSHGETNALQLPMLSPTIQQERYF